jgi:hypothetical protein
VEKKRIKAAGRLEEVRSLNAVRNSHPIPWLDERPTTVKGRIFLDKRATYWRSAVSGFVLHVF